MKYTKIIYSIYLLFEIKIKKKSLKNNTLQGIDPWKFAEENFSSKLKINSSYKLIRYCHQNSDQFKNRDCLIAHFSNVKNLRNRLDRKTMSSIK